MPLSTRLALSRGAARALSLSLSLCAAGLLCLATGCSSSNQPDAPVAQARFPGPIALVSGASTLVRGVAVPPAGHTITLLRVEGQLAQSNDDFLTWRVALPLSWQGPRLLDVELELDARHRYVQPLGAVLEPVTWIGETVALAPGPSGSVLATTATPPALVLLDGAAERAVVSSAAVGTGPAWNAPGAVALSADPRFAYVGDGELLLLVELATGTRAVVSDPAVHAGPAIAAYASMALDPSGQVLLVLDAGDGAVYAVDVLSGARILVADAGRGAGPSLDSAVDLVVDAGGDAYVAVADAVLLLDLDSGDRIEVSGPARGQGPALARSTALALPSGAAATGGLLVADGDAEALVAVDPVSGDRALVAALPGGVSARTLVVDAAATAATLAPAGEADALLRVSLQSGLVSVTQRPELGAGPRWDAAVRGVGVETSATVVPGQLSAPVGWALRDGVVVRVDLTTGTRVDPLAGARSGYDVFALDHGAPLRPGVLATSEVPPNMPLARLARGPQLVTLDLTSGQETTEIVLLDPIRAVAVPGDGSGWLAAVAEDDTGGGDVLALRPPQASAFLQLPLPEERFGPIGFGPFGATVLTFERLGTGEIQLVATDATGSAVVLSGGGVGLGAEFVAPAAVAYDAIPQRILVLERDRLVEVDAGGNRNAVSGGGRGEGPPLLAATALAFDGARNLAYVVDEVRQALVVADLATGDRAVVSR